MTVLEPIGNVSFYYCNDELIVQNVPLLSFRVDIEELYRHPAHPVRRQELYVKFLVDESNHDLVNTIAGTEDFSSRRIEVQTGRNRWTFTNSYLQQWAVSASMRSRTEWDWFVTSTWSYLAVEASAIRSVGSKIRWQEVGF